VVPKWLTKELARDQEPGRWVSHSGGANLPAVTEDHARFDVGGSLLCGPCNNGWSSELEKRLKPILLPLIQQRQFAIRLEADVQAAIACWLSKTVALGDYLDHKATAAWTAQILTGARSTTPPAGVRVWVGAFDHHPWLRHAWLRKPLAAGRVDRGVLHVLAMGDFVGIVHVAKPGTPERIANFGLIPQWFIPIWPSAGPITWPPLRAATVEQLMALAT
jgi:hypothetical protein